ncbi:MAG: hypothetical protein ABSD02_23425 [Steroidobacteraceae bacterium]|jgi:hypothetical protein
MSPTAKKPREATPAPRPKSKATHKWLFPSRIRPNAFSWKSSRVAVDRIREAVGEISAVARHDTALAAEGAVRLIERLSPALEHVDSSSGALGSAVNGAIETLVPIIAGAKVSETVRKRWLDRLFAAHEADEIPYIEILTDYWGELCASPKLASAWADELVGITRLALSPDKSLRGHYHGTTACLDALLYARRFAELYDILKVEKFWHYKRWAVKALAAEGKTDEAIALAEASRGPWTSETDVNRLCEGILLSVGRAGEAYRRYGLYAHRAGTYLATFRAVAKAYPSIPRDQVLADLIALSPGDEGKWFATAKELKLYEVALKLVRESPCDPKTLARAARDFAEREPRFAHGAGFAALYWLVRGQGYEISSIDVWGAYHSTLKAAEQLGTLDDTKTHVRQLVAQEVQGGFVRQILGRELSLA